MSEHACPYPASGCTSADCHITTSRQREIWAERVRKAAHSSALQINRAARVDDEDPEEFCPRCLAGTESSEHFEKCGGA